MLKRERQKLWSISLPALTFILIVASGGAANAEAGRFWRIDTKAVTKELTPSVQVTGADGTLSLKSEISKIQVEVSCSSLSLQNLTLQPEGSISGGTKAKFKGCTTQLNGKVSKVCEPTASEAGTIDSNELKGLLVLYKDELGHRYTLARIEALAGETLGTILMSKECAIGSKVPLIGKLTLKGLNLETSYVTQLFSVGPANELWVISKTNEHQVTVNGSANAALGGEHAGKKWSIPQPQSTWKVKETDVTVLNPPLTAFAGKEGLTFLTTYIGATKLAISCSTATLVGAKLVSNGEISPGFKIKFSGCQLKIEEKVTECQPNWGSEVGVLTSNALKGKLSLHTPELVLTIEGQEGTNILVVEPNKFCAFGSKTPIFGRLTLHSEDIGTEAKSHLFSEHSLTELWFINETRKVTLDGNFTFQLSGEHLGLPWSGLII